MLGQTRHYKIWWFYLWWGVLLWVISAAEPTHAQPTVSNSYWQYDARGQITQVEKVDINGDGFDEFLVVADGSNVTLLNSNGVPRWNPYQVSDEIWHVTTAEAISLENSPNTREIILATRNRLVMLSGSGRLQWQTEIATPATASESVEYLGDLEWRRSSANPFGVYALDYNGDGVDEILVALRAGVLRLHNGQTGAVIWEYVGNEKPAFNALTKVQVVDINHDQIPEILLTYYTERGFSEVVVVSAGGATQWRHSLGGQVTAQTAVNFDPFQPMQVVVANDRGVLQLYDGETGEEVWFRTPNINVTSLTALNSANQPILLVGTAVGSLLAYDQNGRRLWERFFSDTPTRPILNLSPAPYTPAGESEVQLAATLGSSTNEAESAELLLIGGDGRLIEKITPSSNLGLSQLTDINHDGYGELLWATFGTLALRDTGGRSENQNYAVDWAFRLGARPRTALTYDFNQDGQDELLVGSDDGRVYLLPFDGSTPLWSLDFGGFISHVALAERVDGQPRLVIAHNNSTTNRGVETVEGWIELVRPDGRFAWPEARKLEASITSLLVADINGGGRPEILVGTSDGQVLAYSTAGEELWRTAIDGSVTRFVVITGERNRPEIAISTEADQVYILNNKGIVAAKADYVSDIMGLIPLSNSAASLAKLLVITQDGQIRGLTAGGISIPEWQQVLGTIPLEIQTSLQNILISTSDSRLLNLSLTNQQSLAQSWEVADLGRITTLFTGDLTGDDVPDIGLGNNQGGVKLLSHEGRLLSEMVLPSSIFSLVALRSPQQINLVAITDNGVVQSLSARPNQPPLLVNPQVEVNQRQYSLSVTVLEVDQDQVQVQLYLYDGRSENWISQGEKVATRGNETLFWTGTVFESQDVLQYRFGFTDGIYRAEISPTLWPDVNVPLNWTPLLFSFSIGFLVVLVVYLARQMPFEGWRTNQLYRQIRKRPTETMILLNAEYSRQQGAADFLLNLANYARRDRNSPITDLADGLYLLADRPEAALNILLKVLELVKARGQQWWGLDLWILIFRTTQALWQSPTIMELSLLRPRLLHLITEQDRVGQSSVAFTALLAPLTSLRDSNRADRAEDRLVYLHEASVLLRQEYGLFVDRPVTIQNTLAVLLIHRWNGLVNAAIDDLRGRAWLVASLKTKRIIPQKEAVLVFEIENSGRAPAEEVQVYLVPDPAYKIVQEHEPVGWIAAGRRQLVEFVIEPEELDRFRVAVQISYNDRNNTRQHSFEFADLVYILPPVRQFVSIVNPYSPGTPLRRKSQLFFGRESLLNFVIQSVSHAHQPRVLILVGQRRTGKTSALLHLTDYAPEHILPVYVDCQSFGVMEGMPAFLHDLAWFIADALATRQLEVEVPGIDEWQKEPAHLFQRQFLPAVQKQLPPQTVLLLIFDEFEVFEHLVQDGILPSTFFPFLRHLMQHGQGLSFVFAGTHRLEEMSSDYWSVLFNIALYYQVGYLDEAASRELICRPVAPALVYDDLALDKIWRVTAGHPYFLQLVCYTLVNRANQQETSYITISHVNEAINDMLKLGEVHFAYLWQQSSPEERLVLMAIAHFHDLGGPFLPIDLITDLEPYNLALAPPAVLQALRQLVERGILQEVIEEGHSRYELRIGLIGLWIAQNKSLSKLYETGPKQIRA